MFWLMKLILELLAGAGVLGLPLTGTTAAAHGPLINGVSSVWYADEFGVLHRVD